MADKKSGLELKDLVSGKQAEPGWLDKLSDFALGLGSNPTLDATIMEWTKDPVSAFYSAVMPQSAIDRATEKGIAPRIHTAGEMLETGGNFLSLLDPVGALVGAETQAATGSPLLGLAADVALSPSPADIAKVGKYVGKAAPDVAKMLTEAESVATGYLQGPKKITRMVGKALEDMEQFAREQGSEVLQKAVDEIRGKGAGKTTIIQTKDIPSSKGLPNPTVGQISEAARSEVDELAGSGLGKRVEPTGRATEPPIKFEGAAPAPRVRELALNVEGRTPLQQLSTAQHELVHEAWDRMPNNMKRQIWNMTRYHGVSPRFAKRDDFRQFARKFPSWATDENLAHIMQTAMTSNMPVEASMPALKALDDVLGTRMADTVAARIGTWDTPLGQQPMWPMPSLSEEAQWFASTASDIRPTKGEKFIK